MNAPDRWSSLGSRRSLWAAFALIAWLDLALYSGALRGELISDDISYITDNPYTRELSIENAGAILTPGGAASLYTLNYAPVHLLATALERQLFGESLVPYHVVNVLLHALNSVLLVALLLGSGVPARAAFLGGLAFNLHPANVEAVAWISQLKSTGALAFALASLLLLRRRPSVATVLFVLALGTKPNAAAVLPMAAVLLWAWSRDTARRTPHWGWIAAWLAIFVGYAAAQLPAFEFGGEIEVPELADPWVHWRSMAALGARYLVMATTSYGTSAFHEPPRVVSGWSPWWLASIPIALLLTWRLLTALRDRKEEAAYWVFAAAGFVPVSNFFPIYYAMADRYLYFILPGLIGGALLWGTQHGALARPRAPGLGSRFTSRAVGAVALIVLLCFAIKTHQRAALWANRASVLADAARHYPRGTTAHYLQAVRLAHEGDAGGAVAALREAEKSNLSLVRALPQDPMLSPLWETGVFEEFVRELAAKRIAYGTRHDKSTQPWLQSMAGAHELLGHYEDAIALLERAIRRGGPLDSALLVDLQRIREKQRAARPAPQ